MPRIGIALGSNLGDRLAHLRAACGRLREISTGEMLMAPVYRTAPVGCPPGSPDFYNTVVEIGFSGSPLEMLDRAKSIERELGRTPAAGRNAPRVVDLDLLYFGNERFESERLSIPHPRLAVRRFVLQPLADIRPELLLPGLRSSIRALLAALPPGEPELELVGSLAERDTAM
jgi:2-amino-4-hydroxy-6-hydroxymethyldihydropteridine diphosphokinase